MSTLRHVSALIPEPASTATYTRALDADVGSSNRRHVATRMQHAWLGFDIFGKVILHDLGASNGVISCPPYAWHCLALPSVLLFALFCPAREAQPPPVAPGTVVGGKRLVSPCSAPLH